MSSSLTTMAMSDRPLQVVAHGCAVSKYAGQHKGEQNGEPAARRKTGIDIDRMSRSRDGPCDCAHHDAETLQRKHRPCNRVQTLCVHRDERIAGANGVD